MTHRKPIQYKFAENRMRSNLELLLVMKVQYFLLTQIYGPIIFVQSRPGADPDFLKREGK
jgi:hypothetical protein